MEIKRVLPGTKTYRSVKSLYYASFEACERISITRMLLLSLIRRAVDFFAYYEGDTFCGFSFVVCTDCYVYLDYFVVNPELRGQGYGSRIAADILARYPVPGIGETKEPIPGSPDYQKDLRRQKFWERIGFNYYDYNLRSYAQGRSYLVNSTGDYNRENYFAVFDYLSLGPKALLRRIKRRLR